MAGSNRVTDLALSVWEASGEKTKDRLLSLVRDFGQTYALQEPEITLCREEATTNARYLLLRKDEQAA